MCGITGFWDLKQRNNKEHIETIIKNMTNVIQSRGPDDKGTWIDYKHCLSFGHRRLTIIELSKLGKQPMQSRNKRFVITFNGEIYNFYQLKNELLNEKVKFLSNSDTEVLIEALSHWGIKKTLQKISGMFAFALWDKKKKKIYLARDRFGMKPLYFSFLNGLLLFGSQTKSFFKHPKWKQNISLNALGSFFRFGYIPSYQSIFENTYQVLPGQYIVFSKNDGMKKKNYWNLLNIVKKEKNKEVTNNNNVKKDIEFALENSVKNHMISDVPLGSFLSGGIDSSLITALMQKQSSKAIKTFNIGFHEKTLDESMHAKKIANHLGTEHYNVFFSNKDIINLIPTLSQVYDEPFADSSQLPTILLSQITKKKVKVALSGDGGDELFGGYNRYNWAKRIKYFFEFPLFFRIFLGKSLKVFSPKQWDFIIKMIPLLNKYPFAGDKIYKLSDIFQIKKFTDVYSYLISQWQEKDIPINKKILFDNSFLSMSKLNFLELKEQMQIIDMNTYLPDDILTKVDRASMANGLEVRVPFLDENLVKLTWSMNSKDKSSKKLLKNILYKYVPKNLVSRPKMGFSVPLEKWLKGPLKDWADDLLQKNNLNENYVDAHKIRKKWTEHISGSRNWQYQLWPVLIYQSWKKYLKFY